MIKKQEFALDVCGREGAIRRKAGSKKLYVDFRYNGVRVVRSTGLNDSPENRVVAEGLLAGLMKKKIDGSLIFARAFPGASEEEKRYHARFEGWEYRPEPRDVIFETYVEEWKEKVWAKFRSKTKMDDHEQALDDWLLPYFGHMTFDDFTGVELQTFIGQLCWRSGKNIGKPLSGSRVRNILIPLRAIWRSARSRYRWSLLEDPFEFIRDEKAIPPKRSKRPVVFRFGEWERLLSHMDAFYRPIAEIMVMCGLIGSEMAGLRRQDVGAHSMTVVNSVVPRRKNQGKLEKEELKNEYRTGRTIPITAALRKRLDEVLARESGPYVFTMKDGSRFCQNLFRQAAWETAFRRAGLPHKVPYTTRHTFAAWALTLRMDPGRLVRLMGHNSKKMVYEVYGDYVEGLEDDVMPILEYFGKDFVVQKTRGLFALSLLDGESFGESRQVVLPN